MVVPSTGIFEASDCDRRVKISDVTTSEMYEDPIKLSECPPRTRLRLTSINLPTKNLLRMQELGLRPGSEAIVTQHAGFGGLVLNVAGSRVAVDHRSAKLIEAEAMGTEVTA